MDSKPFTDNELWAWDKNFANLKITVAMPDGRDMDLHNKTEQVFPIRSLLHGGFARLEKLLALAPPNMGLHGVDSIAAWWVVPTELSKPLTVDICNDNMLHAHLRRMTHLASKLCHRFVSGDSRFRMGVVFLLQFRALPSTDFPRGGLHVYDAILGGLSAVEETTTEKKIEHDTTTGGKIEVGEATAANKVEAGVTTAENERQRLKEGQRLQERWSVDGKRLW